MVRVSVANQCPTGLSLSNAVIPENIATTTAALVGTLTAEDPDAGDQHVFAVLEGDGDVDNAVFQIVDNRLEIKAGVAVDYETQRQYSIRVQASDGLATFQKPLTILVTDVNEFAPLIEPQTLHVPELSVYGLSVGTVVAHDGDRWQSLRFAITGGNASGAFGIIPTTGEIVVINGGQLDYESQAKYTLTISATDSGQPLRTGTGTVTVLVDDVNEAPIFLTVPERVEGEFVGLLPADDPDAGDTLSFAVRDDPRFEVVAGRLKLKAGASLDRKQGPQC